VPGSAMSAPPSWRKVLKAALAVPALTWDAFENQRRDRGHRQRSAGTHGDENYRHQERRSQGCGCEPGGQTENHGELADDVHSRQGGRRHRLSGRRWGAR
jgi:hypothetical protein